MHFAVSVFVIVVLLGSVASVLALTSEAFKHQLPYWKIPDVFTATRGEWFGRIPFSADPVPTLAYPAVASLLVAVVNIVYLLSCGTTASTAGALRALCSSSPGTATAFIGGLSLYGFVTGTFARNFAPAQAGDAFVAGLLFSAGCLLVPQGWRHAIGIESLAALAVTAASYGVTKQLWSMHMQSSAAKSPFDSFTLHHPIPNFFSFLIIVVTLFIVRLHFRTQHAQHHWEEGVLKVIVGTLAGIAYGLAVALVDFSSARCVGAFVAFSFTMTSLATHALAAFFRGSEQRPLLLRRGPALGAILARDDDDHHRPSTTLRSLIGATAVGAAYALKGPFLLSRAVMSSSAGTGGIYTVLGALAGACIGVVFKL